MECRSDARKKALVASGCRSCGAAVTGSYACSHSVTDSSIECSPVLRARHGNCRRQRKRAYASLVIDSRPQQAAESEP